MTRPHPEDDDGRPSAAVSACDDDIPAAAYDERNGPPDDAEGGPW